MSNLPVADTFALSCFADRQGPVAGDALRPNDERQARDVEEVELGVEVGLNRKAEVERSLNRAGRRTAADRRRPALLRCTSIDGEIENCTGMFASGSVASAKHASAMFQSLRQLAGGVVPRIDRLLPQLLRAGPRHV